jgi:hypothetical protein
VAAALSRRGTADQLMIAEVDDSEEASENYDLVNSDQEDLEDSEKLASS